MKFDKKEKHFWRSNFNIGNLAAVPLEMNGFKSIDTEVDDQFLFYLTSRVPTIHGIYLKFTNVTNEGVKHISKIQNLLELTLREHNDITKECIPYLNKLVDLEYLDILKTKISLEDLPALSNLQNLKELYVSSENTEKEYILEQIINLKEILPNCIVYVNYGSSLIQDLYKT
jgi:Leucine-rich repeat (LRR) protein